MSFEGSDPSHYLLGHRVSPQPHHALVDAAALVLRARHATLDAAGQDTYVLKRAHGPSARQNYKVFKSAVKIATAADENATHAVEHLRAQFREEYFRGFRGMLRRLLSCFFAGYRFENAVKHHGKLDALAERIRALPPPSPLAAPPLRQPLPVFSDDYRDPALYGTVPSYQCAKHEVIWLPPREYLRRVDPDFTRHADEDSLPWLLQTMANVANGSDSRRFAPLMMDPSTVLEHRWPRLPLLGHEGRHRALAAHLLNIPQVPVIVRSHPVAST